MGVVLHPGCTGMNPKWFQIHGRKLNLASGLDYRPGWLNMDLFAPRVDLRHDLMEVPWPLKDESFSLVFANQILEHIPPLIDGRDGLGMVLGEINRVLKIGGILVVGVPYMNSPCDVANPTHYRRFNEDSFHFLKTESKSTLRYMYGELNLELVDVRVARCFRGLGFDSIYHGLKYFGIELNIGRKTGMVYRMVKT